jgi:NADH dehydrogenase
MARVLLLGGSGFIGRHVAERLARDQHAITIPTRRRERLRSDLITLPTVDLVTADIHDDATLERLIGDSDVVINLVGILHSRSGSPYGPDFQRVHVELPRRIAQGCMKAGVTRLLHMSALGAAADGPSEYLRSRGAGEAAVREAGGALAITIFRPSVVFGPGDSFLTLFARMQRWVPVVPLAMSNARFQPVFVEDVAEAIACAIKDPASAGQTFELAGPQVFTLGELVAFAGKASGHARPIIALPRWAGVMQAFVMERLPGRLLSRDNLRSMAVDNVSQAPWPFGIKPTALAVVASTWLGEAYPRSRFDRHRAIAGRPG